MQAMELRSVPAYSRLSGTASAIRFPTSNPALHISLWIAAAAIFSLIGASAFFAATAFGPITQQMATHILLMNVLAPLAAFALTRRPAALPRFAPGRLLLVATVLQIAALWAWHSPAAMASAHRLPLVHALMLLSLFGAALWFWLAVLTEQGNGRWRAIFALLVTGKLFCLIGILLVFAPRLLYAALATNHAHHGLESMLADQHLAGLLMIVACPLTYVLTGVVIAAQWIRGLTVPSAKQPDSLVSARCNCGP